MSDLIPLTVSVYIDDIDKYYAIEDKNWLKLSRNKSIGRIAKILGKTDLHDYLSKNGLTNFLKEVEIYRETHPNEITEQELNAIAFDQML